MTAPSAGLLPFSSASELNNTFGAVFVGFTLHAILYGISVVQFYLYFHSNAKEHRFTRFLMVFLAILTTALVVFWTVGMYQWLVMVFLHPSAFPSQPAPWPFWVVYFLSIISTVVVIGIYTERLWRLKGKYVNLFVIVQIVLDLTSLGFGLANPIKRLVMPIISLDRQFTWLYVVEFSCQTLSNITITVSLCLTLRSMRVGQRRTNTLIWILMKFCISTCVLVSVVTVLAILLFVSSPNTFLYAIVDAVQPKRPSYKEWRTPVQCRSISAIYRAFRGRPAKSLTRDCRAPERTGRALRALLAIRPSQRQQTAGMK